MKVYIIDDDFKIQEWWSRFYVYLREKYPNGEDRDETTINKELVQYNAKLFRNWHRGGSYVEFATTEDYVMFLLRWG